MPREKKQLSLLNEDEIDSKLDLSKKNNDLHLLDDDYSDDPWECPDDPYNLKLKDPFDSFF